MTRPARRVRGRPLLVLVALLAAWVAGRAAVWESPLADFDAPPSALLAEVVAQAPGRGRAQDPLRARAGLAFSRGPAADVASSIVEPRYRPFEPRRRYIFERADGTGPGPSDTQLALAHRQLFAAAMRAGFTRARFDSNPPPFVPPRSAPRRTEPAGTSFAAPVPARADRWSLDAWAFWRQGSDAAPISQGRVPIYGASQVGGTLQWRARPSSPHDPRAYARAYRALVRRGENELALGASARPLPRLPVRLAGEVRVTDGSFATELRPAAFAVTEFAPLDLPHDLVLEAYAQGGYVAGEAATAFADGQVALTREVAAFDSVLFGPARLSVGAGAWGGAQEGARRVDVGPTMRLDLKVGEIPARFSVDWRERVEGDAAPASGVAATLSTSF